MLVIDLWLFQFLGTACYGEKNSKFIPLWNFLCISLFLFLCISIVFMVFYFLLDQDIQMAKKTKSVPVWNICVRV